MKTFLLSIITILGIMAGGASAQTNQNLTLRNGERKSIAPGDLSIQFLAVLEDSRCPKDVQCVWAGSAKIRIKVVQAKGEPQVLTLDTINGAATFGNYEFRLTGITPERRSNVKIRPSDYRATINIKEAAVANTGETVKINRGSQKTVAGGRITIKFVSAEDSRCPVNAKCVTAGNAAVSISISGGREGTKTVVVNTDMGPKGDTYDGYAITLIDLSPRPGERIKMVAFPPAATFTIVRLQR